jgi:hypothetical protein
MPDRTVFGDVHNVTGHHFPERSLDIRNVDRVDQCFVQAPIDALAGKIGVNATFVDCQPLTA